MPGRLSLSLLVAVAALLVTLATGCGGGGGGGDGDPFRIGVITDCAGQDSPSFIAGAELPLLQRGGKSTGVGPSDGVEGASVAGRPVELVIGCAESHDPLAALAQLRRLVDDRNVDAIVGPTHEIDQIVARYARKRPRVTFMLTNYDQASTLRFAASNVFQFELNFAQWSAGLAAYAYYRKGWRNVATVGEGDPPGWEQAAGFDAEFCALGGHVHRLWALGGARHLGRKVSQIPPSVDGVFLDPNLIEVAGFIRRWRRHHHDLARQLVLGAYVPLGSGLHLPGVVTVSGEPWASRGWSPRSASMVSYDRTFHRWFPLLSRFDANYSAVTYYDEVEPLLQALRKVHGKTSDGERKLQRALARLHYASPEGPIHLDKRNQAVGPTYLARIRRDGSYHQFKTVPNVEQTFGGYFTPRSVPPGPDSPACVKGRPPPWARRSR